MKIWLSYPSYPYIIQFIGLWHINLALYLSLDELIKGIISNWCQLLFKELKLRGYEKSIGEFKQLPSSLDRLKELWNGLILDIIHKDYILLYHCDSEHFPLNTREKQAFLILYCVTYIRIGNALFHFLIIIDSSFKLLLFYAYLLWIMTHTQWNK